MKTLIASTFFLVMMLTEIKCQNFDTLNKSRFAIEISQFITGSGFASGTELYLTVIANDRKNISFGLYYCPEQKKISGITIHQEMTLVRNPGKKRVMPYAFYNLIYRFTKTGVTAPEKEGQVSYGLYKSMEHHLGIGMDIRIAKDFHVKSALGYGVYLGSIKKPSKADPITGEINGTNGFSPIAKIGLVYIF